MIAFADLQKKPANAALRNRIRRSWWIGVALLASSGAFGQSLPDPTRPPAGFIDPDAAKGGGAVGDAPAVVVPDPEAGLIFQSVVLPKSGKPVAVIGGRYVPVGGRVDGWELRSANEREAVLVQGAERRVLKLTPLVTKTAVTAPPENPTKKKVSARKAPKPVKPKPTKVSCSDELKSK